MSKHDEFAPLIPSFVGRRGLLIEYGPTIYGCKVVDVTSTDKGMQARVLCDDGKEVEFGGQWSIVAADDYSWHVSYANSRILFDEEAIRRFDAGEKFDIGDYL